MTILASLSNAYDRLVEQGKAPLFGYSNEKVGFVISLNPDGSIAGLPRDKRDKSGKKTVPLIMALPQPVKRTSGIKSNFLWDKSAYVLGISVDEKDHSKEHQAFVDFHKTILKDTLDEGLKAFLLFLDKWKPEEFQNIDWPEEIKTTIKDQNIIFALESERLKDIYLHTHASARQLWAESADDEKASVSICLVSGRNASVARLHPSIKGVWDGQSSGASIVSFNLDAFSSFGRDQGDNAPVSKAAAFAYTTALNKFLEKGSVNRVQLGDASTVFWAYASKAQTAQEAEDVFAHLFEINETTEAKNKIKPVLDAIRQGKPLAGIAPDLDDEDVHFYILGLAPNAARISIRFWFEDTFGALIKNYQRFLSDMRVEPKDKDETISLWKYLREIAVLGKSENVPKNLSGEWMRSILTGTPYPLTLLSSILMRIRADHTINAHRISILKAVLIRNFKSKEAPVALDPENTNPAYHLGRLFAVLEKFQKAALGEINRTIRDSHFSTAMTSPASVFPTLIRLNNHHRSKAAKEQPNLARSLEKQLGEISNAISPDISSHLSLKDQGIFALGYYHQFNYRASSSTQTTATKENN